MIFNLARAQLAGGIAALLLATPAHAQSDRPTSNVFVMGGPFTKGYFEDTFRFWEDHYESNVFAGVGYQHFFYEHPGGLKLGFEAGLGLRVGDRSSAELWGGAVLRFDIVEIEGLHITPSLTAGFSVVTDTIGVETQRAAAINRSVPVLYYLGPEIAVSHDAAPNLEAFARVHHRSGGFGTIADIDGSNGAVLGIRQKF